MTPPNILIVDDDPDLAEGLEILLQLEDMSVARVVSGEKGVEMFRRGAFDVVFIDIKLPGIDGVECLKRIRGIEPDARVLMMTAYIKTESRDTAREAGALDLFQKPLEIDAVMAVLQSVQQEVSDQGEKLDAE